VYSRPGGTYADGMTKTARSHADDLRAASMLAVAATESVTRVVEDMHRTIASGPAILGKPLALPARALTSIVYGHVRTVTGLVGIGVDAVLSTLAPLLGASTPGREREAVLAVLNGVLGDYLLETGSPFAIPMTFRRGGESLPLDANALRAALPSANGKLLVLVHGSSMNDRQWERADQDHGAALAREHGYTPVYLHYNSGLHISTNGRELASGLEALVRAWPVPVEEVSLVAHSMGGLVARSACHVATTAGHSWRQRLKRLATLGAPHHGSPLERGGSVLHTLLELVSYSAPLARLAKIRSAGVTDLRYGNLLDADWEGRDRFARSGDRRQHVPLPEGVACFAIAGTTATTETAKLPGDGLVPVSSALGRHKKRERTLAFPDSHQWIAYGTGHLDLLSRAEVSAQLLAWFGPAVG